VCGGSQHTSHPGASTIMHWNASTWIGHCLAGLYFKGGEGEMELPLHMLPLCCHSLTTGYFHHIVVLSGLVKLSKPKLGKSAREGYTTETPSPLRAYNP
jgi:hypothetical protein